MASEEFGAEPSQEKQPELGDRREVDRLFSVAYEELRRLAFAVRRDDPSATLTPTALVHEAWIKVAASPGLTALSRLEFKRIAARAMRQLLVEAARRRKATKRGGNPLFVTFDESLEQSAATEDSLVALDSALRELERLNPRQAFMVESRFFGGLEVPEVAELLGISPATVQRDWRVAKAWLASEVRRAR